VIGDVYVAFLFALTLLSLASLAVLKRVAPWTSAGWFFTIAYDVAASFEILAHRHLPAHLPYLFLGALTVAFVVAGFRDEPQAEPWWWPQRLQATRAERRRSTPG
jgi:hypothetical protein